MMKRYTYTNVEYNISKFLLKIAEIDCNPVGQRNNVERGYGKKAEAIIRGYLEGKFTGAIVIHERQRQGTEGLSTKALMAVTESVILRHFMKISFLWMGYTSKTWKMRIRRTSFLFH